MFLMLTLPVLSVARPFVLAMRRMVRISRVLVRSVVISLKSFVILSRQ